MNLLTSLQENELVQGISLNDVRRAMPFAGVGLILLGMARRSPAGVLLAAIGGGLVYEGLRTNNWSRVSYEKGMPTQRTLMHDQGIRVEHELTVARSREDLYRYWRKVENLPNIMRYLDSVRQITPTRSHWVAKAPAGMSVSWDAEIINEVENELIGWRSLDGADVPNAGSVQFTPAPGGKGTVIHVHLKYDVPLGPVGAVVARLFGTNPEQTIIEDLRRFKATMEAGEKVPA